MRQNTRVCSIYTPSTSIYTTQTNITHIPRQLGNETQYLTNLLDDDFIERSSIGFCQHQNYNSLYYLSLNQNHLRNHSSSISDAQFYNNLKPLLPNFIKKYSHAKYEKTQDIKTDIFQHPSIPSQSYTKPNEDDEDDENALDKHHTCEISSKDSTLPSVIQQLINNHFMILSPEHIQQYANFVDDRWSSTTNYNNLQVMGNFNEVLDSRQRFLMAAFIAHEWRSEFCFQMHVYLYIVCFMCVFVG